MCKCKYMKCLLSLVICGIFWLAMADLLLAMLYAINGGQFGVPLGKGLFDINPIIINLPQAIIQRYIWADLWGIIVPVLQLKAIYVFLGGFLIPMMIYGLSQWGCNKCQK